MALVYWIGQFKLIVNGDNGVNMVNVMESNVQSLDPELSEEKLMEVSLASKRME